VPAGKITDRGAPGKGHKVIPPESLKKYKLRKYGSSTKKSATERQAAIRKAARAYGTLSTLRKINAIRTLNKRTNPLMYKKLTSDLRYAQRLNKIRKTGGKKSKPRKR
jgi:hypothetical protein